MNLEGLTEKRRGKKSLWYENKEGEIVAKRCSECGEITTMEGFKKERKGLGGRYAKCKVCVAKRDRDYYEENLIKVLEYKQGYYVENRDSVATRRRNWQRNNRDKTALYCCRRRARRANLPDTLTAIEYSEILAHFGNACALTGRTDNLEQEHAIPQSIGGGFTFENIYPMTKSLNCSKFNHNIFEWFEANRQRFKLEQWRFDRLIKWLASANAMSVEEYRAYVYECHANPNEKETKEAI